MALNLKLIGSKPFSGAISMSIIDATELSLERENCPKNAKQTRLLIALVRDGALSNRYCHCSHLPSPSPFMIHESRPSLVPQLPKVT